MERRWGRRIAVDIPIQIATAGAAQAGAQLADLSFTGALIKAEFLLRIRCRILIALKWPYRLEGELSHIAALVTHNHAQGIGVEWCEMGSAAVIQLLRAATTPMLAAKSRVSARAQVVASQTLHISAHGFTVPRNSSPGWVSAQ